MDSHKRMQKVNHDLEDKLLKTVGTSIKTGVILKTKTHIDVELNTIWFRVQMKSQYERHINNGMLLVISDVFFSLPLPFVFFGLCHPVLLSIFFLMKH